MKNKLLNIGSITKDIIIRDNTQYNQIGGAVYYQLCVFYQLKIPVTSIIMIGKDDTKILEELPDTENIIIIKNRKSMEYTNIYMNKKRIQKAKFPKESLNISNLNKLNLNEYKTALISPLSPYEITPQLLKYLKEKSMEIILLIQGFIRDTDSKQCVIHKQWTNYQNYLKYVDIISSDEEEFKTAFNITDLNNDNVLKILDENNLKTIIITKAQHGSTIYTKESVINVPSIKTDNPQDKTGLGDTYIAAFASKKDEYELKKAGLFAALVAKEKLENNGGLKTSKKEIMKKFKRY